MKYKNIYSMKDVCEKTGLTYDTLKYYCNEGLIPNVKRGKNNYRIFDDNDIGWINSLTCIKKCGMSINEMKEYMNLCLKGKTSISNRKILLNKKLRELEDKKKEIQESIDYINWKCNFYDEITSGKRKYFSYLINENDD